MYHFDLPYFLEEQGGWLNRATIDYFVVQVLLTEYGDKVNYWLTHDDPSSWSDWFATKWRAAFKKNSFKLITMFY